MGGKPSKGTRADKRLKANVKKAAVKTGKKSGLFGGKRAALFKRKGGKR